MSDSDSNWEWSEVFLICWFAFDLALAVLTVWWKW